MTHPFVAATTFARTGPGRYEGRFTPDWFQGRGAFGGVVAGALVRAAEQERSRADHALRNVQVHFLAPAGDEPYELLASEERAGSRVSTVSARLVGATGPVALATCTFAAPRPSTLAWSEARPPAVTPWQEVEPFPAHSMMPVFAREHFTFRFPGGPVPFGGFDEARLAGWVGLKDPLAIDGALAVALLDAFPPAAFTRASGPMGGASVALHATFPIPLPAPDLDVADPALLDIHSTWAGDGYTDDHAFLFASDGRLLGHAHQLMALFG